MQSKWKWKWQYKFVLIFILLFVFITSCSNKNLFENKNLEEQSIDTVRDTILLGDSGWESLNFHNAVVEIILEEGYGYNVEIVTSFSDALKEALRMGNIDVYMEYWIYDNDFYRQLEKNEIVRATTNFEGTEGIYVPAYVIQGDLNRNIKPIAPDLEYVSDLIEYSEVFKSEGKSTIYGPVNGWAIEYIIEPKFKGYNLDKYYSMTFFETSVGLDEVLFESYEKGIPWVGYYWEPSAAVDMFNMIRLKEIPYDEEIWNTTKLCDFPNRDVEVVTSVEFAEKYPEVFNFLSHYQTNVKLNNLILSEMVENDRTIYQTAIWFLKEYKKLWHNWVEPEIIDNVELFLNEN